MQIVIWSSVIHFHGYFNYSVAWGQLRKCHWGTRNPITRALSTKKPASPQKRTPPWHPPIFMAVDPNLRNCSTSPVTCATIQNHQITSTSAVFYYPPISHVSVSAAIAAIRSKRLLERSRWCLDSFPLWSQIWDHSPHHFLVFGHILVNFWSKIKVNSVLESCESRASI